MKQATYKPTIGIECHVQLNTKTKLFAAVGNDARHSKPNTLISHICVGMPGALPVLNQAALELAIQAAYVLNTKPEKFSKFDRKHYFYPDLPKGYQITQYDKPIIAGGHVDLVVDGIAKRVNITRVNLEEDAGKTTHPEGADYSLVDLNRAGTPLLEIVSEPELSSASEAKAYARELWLLMKYAAITEGDMYHGHVRFDINVSLSEDKASLGTRTEVKNLNSFRSVENAVAYEIARQTELLNKGEKIVQQTRGWDEAKQKTTEQREKEEAHDYRYFPEPDIPPLSLDDEFISQVKQKLNQPLAKMRQKLGQMKINAKVVEDILDKPDIVPRIMEAIGMTSLANSRRIAFQLLEAPDAKKLELKKQIMIAEMVDGGELNSTAAKKLLKEVLKSKSDPRDAASRLNLLQVSDSGEIDKLVKTVLADNQQAASDLRNGETKAIGFIIGQVMKASHGKANPDMAKAAIKRQLGL